MILYLLKRVISLLPTLALLAFITLALLRLSPGDPADQILGDFASLEDKEALRQTLGLDKGLFEQSFNYFKGLVSFDLGDSLVYGRPVLELILERFPATMKLAISSILFALFFGLSMGLLAALWHGKKKELLISMGSLIGVAIPNFWLAHLLILFFSLRLNLLPVSGYGSLSHYILPTITMGGSLMAIVTKMTAESLKTNLTADYARTARAKGLSFDTVLIKHVLKNSAIPILTIISLQFSVLLTGALVTEFVFDWPGLGTLIVEALRNRDYPLVQGCILFFALSYSLLSLLTDLIYLWVDPRISLTKDQSS